MQLDHLKASFNFHANAMTLDTIHFLESIKNEIFIVPSIKSISFNSDPKYQAACYIDINEESFSNWYWKIGAISTQLPLFAKEIEAEKEILEQHARAARNLAEILKQINQMAGSLTYLPIGSKIHWCRERGITIHPNTIKEVEYCDG